MGPLKLIGGLVVAEVGVSDASPVACGHVDQRDWSPLKAPVSPLWKHQIAVTMAQPSNSSISASSSQRAREVAVSRFRDQKQDDHSARPFSGRI